MGESVAIMVLVKTDSATGKNEKQVAVRVQRFAAREKAGREILLRLIGRAAVRHLPKSRWRVGYNMIGPRLSRLHQSRYFRWRFAWKCVHKLNSRSRWSVTLVPVGGCHSNCDIRGCGYRRSVGIGRFYDLAAGGTQDDTVGIGVGTCISRGKCVVSWKNGGAIGTSEVYWAVENCVSAPADHGDNGDGKGCAYNRAGRSTDLKICDRRAAAECQ